MKRWMLALVAVASIPAAAAGYDPGESQPLPLHVEDAIAPPGGRVAVVFRAYASRPIGQGQVCFTANPPPEQEPPPTQPSMPLAPVSTLVFSSAGDAVVELDQISAQTFELRFVSPSATVNRYGGVFAVVFFDLHPDVAPGSEFDVRLDVENTKVFDGDGVAIDVLPLDGKLSVRRPADPYAVAVEGGRVARGETAQLVVRTFEPVGWAAGRIGLRYDPAVLPGAPVVHADPRHGGAIFSWDVPTPGLLVVDFCSTGSELNTVPGQLLRIELAADGAGARPASTTRVWLDRSLSVVTGADGTLLPLALEDGGLEILPPGVGVKPRFPDEPFKQNGAGAARATATLPPAPKPR